MTSSTKASRVPEVGGGPSTSIFSAGSEGSISDQFMVRVRLQRAVRVRQVLGERLEDLLAGEREVGAALGVGEHDAVKADLHLDRRDAGRLAGLELGVLDAARGIGDVRRVLADAFAEELDAAAGAGRFDDRGREAALLPKRSATAVANGNTVEEPTMLDLLAGGGGAGQAGGCDGKRRGAGEESAGHGESPCCGYRRSGIMCPPRIP